MQRFHAPELLRQLLLGRFRQEGGPVLVPFALSDHDEVLPEVDVFDPKAQALQNP